MAKLIAMKNIYYAFVGLVFLLSCEKEYVVSGEVVDSLTRKPLSGINIGYYRLGQVEFGLFEPYVAYPISYHQMAVTDQNGQFDFVLPSSGDIYLASDNINERYKEQARVNGLYSRIQTRGSYVSEPDKDFYWLPLGRAYKLSIEADPKPLCRFDYPTIPAEWAIYGCSIIMKDALSTTLYLNAVDGLADIKHRVYAVESEDQHAKGALEVWKENGPNIKKIEFDVYCPVGDTTLIWLNW